MPLGTLRDQYLSGNVPEDDILMIFEQSLSALAYLHGLKPPIAHRDIKPDNILVRCLNPLYIKLADFGLAKEKTTKNPLKTICGTATYAAPEIAKYLGSSRDVPTGKYTTAVDSWSLGVVILWCGYGLPDPGEGGGKRDQHDHRHRRRHLVDVPNTTKRPPKLVPAIVKVRNLSL